MQFEQNLNELHVSSDLIESEEFQTRYPMLNYPEGSGAILEHDGGVLMANKCGQSLRVCYVLFCAMARLNLSAKA